MSAHWSLLALTTDALGNQTAALAFDFRALLPVRVQDANQNVSEMVLDDLGRVIAVAVMGKGTEADSLDALKVQLADRAQQGQLVHQFLAHVDAATAASLLADATTRWIYDETQLPVCVAAISRERHVRDLAQTGDPLKLQLAFEYSGGAGNVVMTKLRVAPGDAWTLDAQDQKVLVSGADPCWVGNGRTVLDNKGRPVKHYEPYFSVNHLYESDRQLTDVGVSPILSYDSLGRHIRTDHPDGTYELTRFDSWSQQLLDRNDTVKSSRWYADRMALAATDPRRLAAQQSELHGGTPTTFHLDSLGRPMCSVAHNRGKNVNGVVVETFPRVVALLDVEGNALAITDARGNSVTQHGYDLVGRALHQTSMDAGERWLLPDVVGTLMYQWDSRAQRVRHVYDELRRPVDQWLSVGGASETLMARTLWGESVPSAESLNLRGRVWKSYDSAGLVETVRHDFKGNLVESTRRFTTTYDQVIAWPAANPDSLLDDETFRTRAEYDALNRPTHLYSPDTPSVPASEILPVYDESSRLSQVSARLRGASAVTSFVGAITYNEKSQRLAIEYGSGVRTRDQYEPDTFRLSHIATTRGPEPALQDLSYAYDPIGNITSLRDDAQETHYFNGDVVPPTAGYEYDALYRLTRALGREQIGQNMPPDPWDAERSHQILPGDGQAMQGYEQRDEYDLAGNIATMIHNAGSGQFINRWTRDYSYEAANNRLISTQIGQNTISYSYNPHGSMATMPHLQEMDWDPAERLQHIRQGTTHAYYGYDAHGARVRKVVDKQGGQHEVRLYLGAFEIFRRYQNGALSLQRETLHVMDDQRRIALVETRTHGDDGSPPQLIRYQLSNHLGSACVETDEHGDIITYEEYHPHGTTAWQAGRSLAEVSLKRYRYSGRERDEENGFGYHGARYYAPWLARWTSCDPEGFGDGVNLYRYCRNNPIIWMDHSGASPRSHDEIRRDLDHTRHEIEDVGRGVRHLENLLEKALRTSGFLTSSVKNDPSLLKDPEVKAAIKANDASIKKLQKQIATAQAEQPKTEAMLEKKMKAFRAEGTAAGMSEAEILKASGIADPLAPAEDPLVQKFDDLEKNAGKKGGGDKGGGTPPEGGGTPPEGGGPPPEGGKPSAKGGGPPPEGGVAPEGGAPREGGPRGGGITFSGILMMLPIGGLIELVEGGLGIDLEVRAKHSDVFRMRPDQIKALQEQRARNARGKDINEQTERLAREKNISLAQARKQILQERDKIRQEVDQSKKDYPGMPVLSAPD